MDAATLMVTARRRNGLTQAQMAARAGTSQPVISAYEHGARDPSLGTLRRLLAGAGERLELRLGRAIGRTQSARVTPGPWRGVGRRPPAGRCHPGAPATSGAVHVSAPRLDGRPPAQLVISLPERIIAVDGALAAVPHAFGGALALAYHAEPRATRDIDVNVFVPADSRAEVLDPLERLGASTEGANELIDRDGQARVLWDSTPIDLFFAYDEFHHAADRGAVTVPFADVEIRVLSASHLTVCKAVFDRPKDWVDIDAMLELDAPIDVAEVMRWVGRICGDEDPRYVRIATVLASRAPRARH